MTITAHTPDGRTDTEIGAVGIKGLSPNDLCNAMMKAVTKAKRRVTLAICGLGGLDESEIETIPDARPQSTYFDDDQVWRKWKSPDDAILWAEQQLPHMTKGEIQAEFEALPTTNGEKAPAWVNRVNELLTEEF